VAGVPLVYISRCAKQKAPPLPVIYKSQVL
jgi:hypothetical protein